jgi:methionine-S-sulfoxide reductase
VVRTRAGYTGGTQENPTYYDLGDHTETVEIDFDPAQITYEELLDVFWQSHTPTAATFSRQYMSAIFYHGEEQKRLALQSRDRLAATLEQEITTEILAAGTFYLAEDYHQKYNLRRYEFFFLELAAIYPRTEDLIASTAAARLNGYLGGYGSRAQLEAELDSLGLSPQAGERLMGMVRVSDCPVE